MSRQFISALDERGRACVVKGRVNGVLGESGFVNFKAADGCGEIVIHKRFVYADWFAAWKSARRSSKRFRASARDGYASTRIKGANPNKTESAKRTSGSSQPETENGARQPRHQ